MSFSTIIIGSIALLCFFALIFNTAYELYIGKTNKKEAKIFLSNIMIIMAVLVGLGVFFNVANDFSMGNLKPIGKLENIDFNRGFWDSTSLITLENGMKIKVDGEFFHWERGMVVTKPESEEKNYLCLDSICKTIKG